MNKKTPSTKKKLAATHLEMSKVSQAKNIDYSDIPETSSSFWKDAEVIQYIPSKYPITIRLDEDVIAWFKSKSKNKGYQTYINAVLRSYMKAQNK